MNTTNTTTADVSHLGQYTKLFKGWRPAMGPKPTAAQLATVHLLGLRPGKQALANAMYLRDGGATSAQIVMACGAPQLNRMRGLITDGLARRNDLPADDHGHTVYSISLTPKGDKRVSTRQAMADKALADQQAAPAVTKPAKAKRTTKRKAKPAPVTEPVAPTDPATVGGPVMPAGEAPAGDQPQPAA